MLAEVVVDEADLCRMHDATTYIDTPQRMATVPSMWERAGTSTSIAGAHSLEGDTTGEATTMYTWRVSDQLHLTDFPHTSPHRSPQMSSAVGRAISLKAATPRLGFALDSRAASAAAIQGDG